MISAANREDQMATCKSQAPEARQNAHGSDNEGVMPEGEKPCVMVVDDEEMIRQQLERLYTQTGYTVVSACSAENALEQLERRLIDLLVTDIRLPGLSGVELTQQVRERSPDVPVIVITGYADIGAAIELLRLGASDYIRKPFSAAAIRESTRIVLEKSQPYRRIHQLRNSIKLKNEFAGMLSQAPEMHRVFETIQMVSPTDSTVLIEGETGTGKELVANAIHYQSRRREGPLVTINCGGIPESLLESELFGYERGAFTGADQTRAGKIELAHGGTLFLDEIESMSLTMQAKLLRALEQKKVQRLGSSRTVKIDMRVIAATNTPAGNLVAEGKMRRDFFYRVSVITIMLIPLRQRRGDIPLLVHNFFRRNTVATLKRTTSMSSAAMKFLMEYDWPGNIRQLQNVLERAVVLTHGRVIKEIDLLDHATPCHTDEEKIHPDIPLREWLQGQEKQFLVRKLESCGGRIELTAKSCGMDIKTLYRKMRSYSLSKERFRTSSSTAFSSVYQNDLDGD